MAPSTLGTFLRAFTFGHIRQLDRVPDQALERLIRQTFRYRPERDWPDSNGQCDPISSRFGSVGGACSWSVVGDGRDGAYRPLRRAVGSRGAAWSRYDAPRFAWRSRGEVGSVDRALVARRRS
jgi:hypothetical protein